jgi:formylglycine-generating enzyme required for sulfatase activity
MKRIRNLLVFFFATVLAIFVVLLALGIYGRHLRDSREDREAENFLAILYPAIYSFKSEYHQWPGSPGKIDDSFICELEGCPNAKINVKHIDFLEKYSGTPMKANRFGFPFEFYLTKDPLGLMVGTPTRDPKTGLPSTLFAIPSSSSAWTQNPPGLTTTPVTPPPTVPSPPVGPTAAQPWTNSLGMKFVPAGTDGVLFSIWDVRVQDFQAYAQATGYHQFGGIYVGKVVNNPNGGYSLAEKLDPICSWDHPGFEQGPTHPVAGVSWDDAKDFCQWLTDKERKEGTLGSNQTYRLPTDAEWSKAVGDGKYPWGDAWPPPEGVGNYADEAFASSLPGTDFPHIPGNDGYPQTSPVGSFRANTYGLYDMGGNVWQWCEDWYQASMNSDELRKKFPEYNDDGGGKEYKVSRGASWSNPGPIFLLSSFHTFSGSGFRFDNTGFRVVVVVSP